MASEVATLDAREEGELRALGSGSSGIVGSTRCRWSRFRTAPRGADAAESVHVWEEERVVVRREVMASMRSLTIS